jgi:hypothetical protein
MLITPLFVRSSFLLKVILLSTNVDYLIVYRFVLFTLGYCVVHQCWLPHCLSVSLFYLRLLCCPPLLITPFFVRSSFLLRVIVLSTIAVYPFVCRSSFLLKVIVLSSNTDYPIVCPFSFLLKVILLSTNVDYLIVCPFVLFTLGYCVVHQCWLPHCLSVRLFY